MTAMNFATSIVPQKALPCRTDRSPCHSETPHTEIVPEPDEAGDFLRAPSLVLLVLFRTSRRKSRTSAWESRNGRSALLKRTVDKYSTIGYTSYEVTSFLRCCVATLA